MSTRRKRLATIILVNMTIFLIFVVMLPTSSMAVSLTTLSDGSSEKKLTFSEAASQTVYLKIPQHAQVESAYLNLSGYNRTLWVNNSSIISGLEDVVYESPTVFQKDSTWYLISGDSEGTFHSYSWTGSAWQSDSSIVSGLEDVVYESPTIFQKDSTWYLISADSGGTFHGYSWTGSAWQSDPAIINGLEVMGIPIPKVFQKDSTWYLIAGDIYGQFFHGYQWTGSAWQWHDAIISGLEYNHDLSPEIFQKDSVWYLISEGTFHSYSWTGSAWQSDSSIVSGLEDVGYESLTVFQKDSVWYLIASAGGGTLRGFNQSTLYPTNPYLEIGTPDGIGEWSYAGEFSTTETTPNFSSKLNEYLSTAEPDENGNILVPLVFHSGSVGIIEISNINIQLITVARQFHTELMSTGEKHLEFVRCGEEEFLYSVNRYKFQGDEPRTILLKYDIENNSSTEISIPGVSIVSLDTNFEYEPTLGQIFFIMDQNVERYPTEFWTYFVCEDRFEQLGTGARGYYGDRFSMNFWQDASTNEKFVFYFGYQGGSGHCTEIGKINYFSLSDNTWHSDIARLPDNQDAGFKGFYCPADDRIYVFGGWEDISGNACNDVSVYNPNNPSDDAVPLNINATENIQHIMGIVYDSDTDSAYFTRIGDNGIHKFDVATGDIIPFITQTPYPEETVLSLAYDEVNRVIYMWDCMGKKDWNVYTYKLPEVVDAELIALWRFEEGVGDITLDSSGNGHDGTIYGAGWTGDVPPEDGGDWAVEFDGVDDYADCGNIPMPVEQFTISFWIKLHSLNHEADIVGKELCYKVFINDSRQIRFQLSNGGWHSSIGASEPLDLDTWYHVACTYDGSFARIYINGEKEVETAESGYQIDNSNSFKIGAVWCNPPWFVNATIDEVKLYNFPVRPLKFVSLTDKLAVVDRLLEFTIKAQSPDYPDTDLIYSADNLPAGAVFNPYTQMFSWYPTQADKGSYEVSFTVSDDENSVTENIVITTVVIEEVPICTISDAQQFPDIYEDRIVWQEGGQGGGTDADIYMYDISTGDSGLLHFGGSRPAIYEDKVVWIDHREGYFNPDIYLYDLTIEEDTPICANPYEQRGPDIYGNKVIWRDGRNGSYDIYMYDLATGGEIPICTASSDQRDIGIYEDRIVWRDSRSGNSDVYLYDLYVGEERQITSDIAAVIEPAIFEDKIVWCDWRNGGGNSDIYMYDLTEEKETQITTGSRDERFPAVYGDKIVWTGFEGTASSIESAIYLYDLAWRQEVQITGTLGGKYYPDIYQNKVVWQDNRAGNWDIYMARLIYAPQIDSVNPTEANTGGTLTISGVYFGDTQEGSTVKFDNGAVCSIESWSDVEVICTVPADAQTGLLRVITEGGVSNGIMVTVSY